MIPLQDSLPRRTVPVVTWGLIAVNTLVFLLETALPEPTRELVIQYLGLVPARLTDPVWAAAHGYPPGAYLTLFTHLFLHGGWVHILGNMWTLWIFGDNVEDRMGHLRFLIFYFLCGFVAALVHVHMYPHSTIPTIGASGAISGVLGAYLLMFPAARIVVMIPIFIFPFIFEVPAVFFLVYWYLLQVFSGTLSLALPEPVIEVAWWAHVGGFLAGMFLHRFFCLRGRCYYRDEEIPGVVSYFDRINR
ncbi:rhomboid family intramembrane serine protease [Thermosulfurimonas sp.]|uniref:rhomboid family intramembrane serine protease n=1 Tax=Thermosulfurimonas sp. TaxID=2080236 RepID=UPI0025DD90B9|nr:rhomboid family intramembrane serine protease [Thermosulfurimonas sp.]